MSKTITLKLTLGGRRIGPFTITDNLGNTIATDVPKDVLINGISYLVEDNVSSLTVSSTGLCTSSKSININRAITPVEIANSNFEENNVSSLWRHLTVPESFNKYYGGVFPYILEVPFSSNEQTEILQSIKDYSKVFKYLPDNTGVFSYTDRIELDDRYFNKLVVYNNQQSSGILKLVAKPKNNLKEYLKYPLYNADSRSIIYTKSDGYYKVNNIFDVVKSKSEKLFIVDCNTLSIDRQVNQDNMLYTQKSFNKSLMRAKDSKCRFILEESDVHIVSQLLLQNNQINYK